MRGNQNEIIQNYFKTLHLELIIASCCDRVSQNWRRPLSADGFNRFYLILGGEGWLQVKRQKFYPVSGQLYFLPADTPLAYSTISANTFHKYWCHFSANVGSFHLSHLIDFPYYIEVDDMPYMQHLFEQLKKANQKSGDITSPLRANTILYEILTYYMDRLPPQAIRLSSTPAISCSNQILQYIEEHLDEPLTPKALAEAFHYSPNYFSRYFKNLFHVTPIEYINEVRIERAKWLLTHSNQSIEKIASQIGLERFYFSNLFKRFTMLSPSEYRQAVRSAPRRETGLEKG
ncbi:helix-turn-helix domain-containing protein [Paenibacillus elgii]